MTGWKVRILAYETLLSVKDMFEVLSFLEWEFKSD